MYTVYAYSIYTNYLIQLFELIGVFTLINNWILNASGEPRLFSVLKLGIGRWEHKGVEGQVVKETLKVVVKPNRGLKTLLKKSTAKKAASARLIFIKYFSIFLTWNYDTILTNLQDKIFI